MLDCLHGAVLRGACVSRALATLLVLGAAVMPIVPGTGHATIDEAAPEDPVTMLLPDDFELVARGLVGGSREVAPLLASLLELAGEERVSTWTRIALGADALLRGDRDGAIAEFEHASAIAPGTPYGADADLALGLGSLMTGDRDGAVAAFRRASTGAVDERGAYADVSLGRLLAADGDHAGAEESFRRVYDHYPLAMVADDAALGLARSLDAQGRTDEARGVLAESEHRYERRGRYKQAAADPALRWDRVARLSPDELAAALRAHLAAAVERGESPIEVALAAIVDRSAARELRRARRAAFRRDVAPAPAPPEPPIVARGATTRAAALRSSAAAKDGASARGTSARGAPGGVALSVAACATLALLGACVWLRRSRRRPTSDSGEERSASRA